MANLANIIAKKARNDEEWKAQRQADRDNAVAMQDAGIVQIITDPEMYMRYLQMQGSNLSYSVGNVALCMFQKPEFTQIGTKERWKMQGRYVPDHQYDRAESQLDAESVSCILCEHFGIEHEAPDLSNLQELYGGWTPQEARQALDAVQDICKKIGGSVERNLAPPQRTRGNNSRRPSR